MRSVLGIIVIILLVVGSLFAYFRYFYVFGEGVKAGELNFLVKKGYVFKTYEGKLIQSGFRSNVPGGSIGSNEFEFSVADPKIAEMMMRHSGKEFELHYKEYFGSLPWRGVSVYIVDSILSMRDARGNKVLSPKLDQVQ